MTWLRTAVTSVGTLDCCHGDDGCGEDDDDGFNDEKGDDEHSNATK